MLAALISGTVLIFLVIFLQKRRRLKGPVNVYEENQLPLRLSHSEQSVALAYIYLAAWVISKNSRNSTEKVAFIHRYFKAHFDQADVEIGDELTRVLRFSTNIRSVARWVLKHMKDGKERLQLIDFLLELSFADGDIIDREYVAIARFADLTGIKAQYIEQAVFSRREAIYKGNLPTDSIAGGSFFKRRALFRLQLMDGATKEDIKRAYRKLAGRYHPDRFQQASEEERVAAGEKFLEIKEAYDFLMGT